MNPRWVGGRIRFIPAYAGNSAGNIRRPPKASVHPRLRGELTFLHLRMTMTTGSSPLTRGTHENYRYCLNSVRFIPAYAGNSSAITINDLRQAVHPRLRGELRLVNRRPFFYDGSSPLTRGTPRPMPVYSVPGRFIPAYAGNSLKQGIEHLTNSSKDFLSGKYAKNPETVLNHFKNSSLD